MLAFYKRLREKIDFSGKRRKISLLLSQEQQPFFSVKFLICVLVTNSSYQISYFQKKL